MSVRRSPRGPRRRSPWTWAAIPLIGLGCASGATSPAAPAATAGGGDQDVVARTAILAINDIYRIAGLDDGLTGGLPRVRSLRKSLEAEYPDLLLLHAGDLLYPSFLSRTYDGEQMIDVLNHLDGDGEADDPRMLIVFGNHEFDQDDLADAAILDARVKESQFRWLGSGVKFLEDSAGQPLVSGPSLVDSVLMESGGIRIGIFGVTTDLAPAEYVEFRDPLETAKHWSAELRRQGAEVVIGLTHLTLEEDKQLLATLGGDGPDIIFGGHEHTAQQEQVESSAGGDTSVARWVLKADADARSATVVEILKEADGRIRLEPREPVGLAGDDPPPDEEVEKLAAEWIREHDRVYCGKIGLPPGCLRRPVGHTRTELVAEETEIRNVETSFGNWMADLMLGSMADRGAQIAFVNSGSLRLNQDLPADSDVRLAHIEEMFQYSAYLRLIQITGETLQAILDHSVKGWPGQGHWLQIAGFAFRHDPESGKAYDLTLLGPDGPRPVDPQETLLAVTSAYLAQGNDGYEMLEPIEPTAERGDLKHFALAALRAAGKEGIAPLAEGRICNPPDQTPCLAQTP